MNRPVGSHPISSTHEKETTVTEASGPSTHADSWGEPELLPLEGVRVLEISSRVAGAYCGFLLASLGARVQRVVLETRADVSPEASPALLQSLHRGKSAIDLSAATGVTFDLVITDSTCDDDSDGAVSARVQAFLAEAPELPLVEISLHEPVRAESGERVPAAGLTASAVAAMSWAIGSPGREPLTLPYDIPEYLVGTEAAGLCVARLLTSGSGPRAWSVVASDVLASYVGTISANFIHYGRAWRRDGPRATESGGSYPAAMFPTRDGFVSIMCRTSREWNALLKAMGDPVWAESEDFRDARIVARQHSEVADEHLTAWTATHTASELAELSTEFGFYVAPVRQIGAVLDDVQLSHRGALRRAVTGDLMESVPPWRFRTRSGDPQETPAARPTRPSWTQSDDPELPLAGLRVLDLSWVWSGPMVTATLADLGAEIVKIEHASRPDPARLRGRAVRNGLPVEGPELEVTPYFNQMNRGKKSVSVNLTDKAGADLIRALAAECDVVVENMRPGVLDRKGLGFSSLVEVNPSIVMLSMSMAGATGPGRGLGGYAPVMSGLAGLDALVGYDADHLIGLYNPALGDPNAAMHAVTALLSCLYGRRNSGAGVWIDLSQVEALLSVLRAPLAQTQLTGSVAVPVNGHHEHWPHGTWRCVGEDRWVSLAARTDAERARLCRAIGFGGAPEPGAPADPAALAAAVAAWCATRERDDVVAELAGADLAVAPVQSFEEMAASDWLRERGFMAAPRHPFLGDQPIFATVWRRGESGFLPASAAPLLGADTQVVLQDLLGMDDDTFADLKRRGVVT